MLPVGLLEAALDVDMVSAVYFNCTIMLVETNSPIISDMAQAVQGAVKAGADVVSNSYGYQGQPSA